MIWFPRRLRGTCDPEDVVAGGRGAGAGSRRKSLLFNTPPAPSYLLRESGGTEVGVDGD